MDFHFARDRTILGTVFTRAGEEELSLSELDRMNHMLVIGKTGMGKTTLLKNIALQDIYADRGVGVVDPHGDLSPELLEQYPRHRARDLVYLDPNDQERVVTFNIFEGVPHNKIAVAAANLVSSLKAIWGDIGWGARMERILYFSSAALMEAPGTSLLGLPRLLVNDDYRAQILDHVHDPVVHNFFAEQYAIWDEDYRSNAIEPVLNKVETLLASPVLRAMIGSAPGCEEE